MSKNGLEKEFQSLVRLAVSKARIGVTLWRQPTGKIRTDRETWVECAPVGAADLTGVVSPEGWRVEVEVKGRSTPITPAQTHWRDALAAFGAVALIVRDDGTPTAVESAVEALREAIEKRRGERR